MAKEFKTIGINPVLVDDYGRFTALNDKVYKSEAELTKAHEKGEVSIPEGYAGVVIFEVKNWVDVKEAKPASAKAAAKPEGSKPAEGEPKA